MGRHSYLGNNAGVSGLSLVDDPDDSKWFNILDTNLSGMYLIMKEVLKHMPFHHGGRIINIWSVLGKFGGPRLYSLLHNQACHDWVHSRLSVESGRQGHHSQYHLPRLG